MDSNLTNIINKNLQSKFNETINLLNKNNFNISDNEFKIPSISYNLKGKTAGKAYLQKNLIKLNNELTSNPIYFKSMSEDTLYHELAHLFIYFLYTTKRLDKPNILTSIKQTPKPHGVEWKTLMILMGQSPNVTHNFIVTSSRKTSRITYICNCREHEMTKAADKKINKGVIYTCKKCKTPLKLKPGAFFKLL